MRRVSHQLTSIAAKANNFAAPLAAAVSLRPQRCRRLARAALRAARQVDTHGAVECISLTASRSHQGITHENRAITANSGGRRGWAGSVNTAC